MKSRPWSIPCLHSIKILCKDKDMNGKTYWDDDDDDYGDADDIESVTNWLSSRQRAWWVHIDRRSSRGQGLIHPADKICWKIRDIFLSYMRKTPTIYANKICWKINDITKGLIESWQNMLSVDTHDFTHEMASHTSFQTLAIAWMPGIGADWRGPQKYSFGFPSPL